MEILAPRAEVSIATFRLRLPEGASCRAVVLLQDIGAMLEETAPAGLRSFRLTGKHGRVLVTAVKHAVIQVPVHAEIALEVHDGREVRLRLASAKALGANLAPFVEASVEAMNPLFSVDSLPIPARISSVESETDRLVAELQVPPLTYPE